MNEQVAALMAERAELIATKRDQIDGLVRQLREATAARDQAVALLQRLQEWIENECGADLPFTQEDQDRFDALVPKTTRS